MAHTCSQLPGIPPSFAVLLSYHIRGAIGLTPLALNGTEISADNLTFANVYDADSGLGGQGLIGLSFPLNSAIFGAVTAARNESGTPLTATEAQQYYPLVPLLQLEGKIDQSIFGLVVDRIPADIVAPADANVYNYTYGSGALTLGDFPEGYTCVNIFVCIIVLHVVLMVFTPYPQRIRLHLVPCASCADI